MNLRFLIDPDEAEGHPFKMFLAGTAYAIVGVVLALLLFRHHASFVMVTMAVVATLPIVHKVISCEEKKDETIASERRLLREHERAIKAFFYLFLGFVLGFFASFMFLPSPDATSLFSVQLDTITTLQNATGAFLERIPILTTILLNNIRVLLFAVLFSLVFGSGALFVLAWNGSVMAAAVGSFMRSKLALASGSAVLSFSAVSGGLLRYLLHGLPEIAAYFVGGLAGGILYNALIRHGFSGRVLRDVGVLLAIAIGILFLSAVTETYITPFITASF